MSSLKSQITLCNRAQIGLAGSLVIVAGLFYLMGYRPQIQRLAALNQSIAQLQRDLAVNQAQSRRLPGVASDLNRLRARLADFKKLPPTPELGEFVNEITDISRQSDLRKLEYNFGVPRRSEQFTEQPVSLKFQGDFLGVFTFLCRAEDMQRLTRTSSIAIHSADADGGTVEVDLSMNLYFLEG